MRHYNTWLFSEEATRCFYQITSDKAIIDRKMARFARNIQFSLDNSVAEAGECCATTIMRKVKLELEFNFLFGSGFLSLSAAGD